MKRTLSLIVALAMTLSMLMAPSAFAEDKTYPDGTILWWATASRNSASSILIPG